MIKNDEFIYLKKKDFEIYEFIIKKYVIKNIYKKSNDFNKHIFKIREILNKIKTKFYKLKKNIALWENNDKIRISTL